jgi:hypothetical protein
MPGDEFHQLFEALLNHVRGRISRGDLSERGLARLMGYSQPHVHNVLAGVRHMNARFADDLLGGLGLSLQDLKPNLRPPAPLSHVPVPLCSGEISPNREYPSEKGVAAAVLAPASALPASAHCLAFRVGADENSMWPTVWPGDTVVVDPSLRWRRRPDVESIYILRINGRGYVRRCHGLSDRLLIVSDQEPSAGPPISWVSLENRKILDVVRGRIVWIGRSLV